MWAIPTGSVGRSYTSVGVGDIAVASIGGAGQAHALYPPSCRLRQGGLRDRLHRNHRPGGQAASARRPGLDAPVTLGLSDGLVLSLAALYNLGLSDINDVASDEVKNQEDYVPTRNRTLTLRVGVVFPIG